MPADLNVIHAAQLARILDRGGPRRGRLQGELDLVADGAVAIRGGQIVAAGPTRQVLEAAGADVPTLDASGLCVLPGLVDCHSHPLYAGHEGGNGPAREYVRRLEGAKSWDIRAEGGGIWAVIEATRNASDQALLDSAARAYADILAGGVTTLEVKSGFGYTCEQELRQLRLLRESAARTPMDLVYTYVGAEFHPRDGTSLEACVQNILDRILPAVRAQGIAEFHDMCCEDGDYSAPLIVRLLEASRRLGMPTRVHADANSHSKGWRTAVEGGAVTADHLTYTPDEEIRALAGCDTVAVVMPLAEQIFLDQRRANARLFIECSVPLAVSTDFNANIHATSLPLTIALACTWFRLTPAEAIVGATLNAAYALRRGGDRGSLDVGKRGDLAILDCSHPDEIALAMGAPLVRCVIAQGQVVHRSGPGAPPAA
jgi:imidazolonepropionase